LTWDADRPKKVPVVFYRTRAGAEVVRDWLRGLEEGDRSVIGQDVHYRWPVGMPLYRAMGDGLWEVRSDLPSDRIARVLFSFEQGKLIIKKSRKTSDADLTLARKRRREFDPRG